MNWFSDTLPSAGDSAETVAEGIRVNHRREGLLAGLPVKESERVQLGPGAEEYRSRRIFGRDLVMLAYRLSPRIVNYTVPHPDWAFVIVPIDTRPELRMNGRTAGRSDWFLATSPDGYVTAGENRCHIAFAVRRTRLEANCAALMGIEPEDVCLRNLFVSPEERVGDRMRRALVDVAMNSCQPAGPAGTFSISKALERDVLCLVSEQLAPLLARSPGSAAYRLPALEVVRAATERAALDSAASLADLCSAAGVSQRWLYKCFMEVTGASPYRYLRMARLTRARDLLLSADPHETRVKQVALTVGYRLSGRFAAEYRALYGENPTSTLERSAGTAC